MEDVQAFLPTISVVVAETTERTITASECNGRFVFTNEGTTEEVGFEFTLPPVVAGLRINFIVATAKILQVLAVGDDTIWAGGNVNKQLHANTIGDHVELIGVNNTEWFALGTQFASFTAKGYILGGNTGAATAVIEQLTFSDDTSAHIDATLDTAKHGGAGVNSGLMP